MINNGLTEFENWLYYYQEAERRQFEHSVQ